jgi:hypothetical protein
VLPNTLKVGLVGYEGGHLVGVDEVLFLHQLGSHFAKGVVFSFKLFAAFFSSRINAKNELGFQIGVGETVQLFESFLLVVGVFEKMAASSPPGRLGNFVIEETGWETLADEFNTEKLKGVWCLTVAASLHRGPLLSHVLHGVLPSLSGVYVDLPAVLLLWASPVGNGETFEDSAGQAVEPYITDALKQGLGVEVLLVDVIHDVRILMELVDIDVLNAEAYIILN